MRERYSKNVNQSNLVERLGLSERDYNSLTGTVVIRDCEMMNCEAGEYGGALYLAKEGYSLTIDGLACYDCYGTGSEGLTICISRITEFVWNNLCIHGSGNLVYAVINQPAESDFLQICSARFTANDFIGTRSRTWKHAAMSVASFTYICTC